MHTHRMHTRRSRKCRFELVLPRVEALRALADLTAQAGAGRLVIGDETVDVGDCASLKIGIKHFGASSLLKVSLRYPALGADALPTPAGLEAESVPPAGPDTAEAAATAAPEARPRYKNLKKGMKQTFKGVVAALRAGVAPDAALLGEFIAASRTMTSYPGRGDAFYPAYDAEIDRLEAAAAAGDVQAMTASAAALDRMKKECHSRHA